MNARGTRRPRGGAGSRPRGRSTGRNTNGPTNGCAIFALAGAGTFIAAIAVVAERVVTWL